MKHAKPGLPLEIGLTPWGKRACAVFLLCAATAIALPAQTFTTLHSFDGTDGVTPEAALIQATDGNLYGTTFQGGTVCEGTVFKITPNGTLTTLNSLGGLTEGRSPVAGLVQATNGNFYGTTNQGVQNCQGTVFKITPSGTVTTLYNFCSQSGCTDGALPDAALIQATDGNFYGTTANGGASGACSSGCGTVFKISPTGTLTTLHSFDSTDGFLPEDPLIQSTDGSFYGTTESGGLNSGGTVFKITPTGTLATLYSFCPFFDCTTGSNPVGALVQGTDGNFYGTTFYGGTSNACALGCGTVFKITPSGTLTALHSFDLTDGENPAAALVEAPDGNFYGTTAGSGTSSACRLGCGTLFEITSTGTLTTLHSFDLTDGQQPFGALVQDTNGTFYGTTEFGGAGTCFGGCGTVFSLSVGLRPFVEIKPALGKAGMAVKILGTNLTGARSVTFNGTAATFTVVSSSLITTTVPAGATTGKVQVATPSGTLSSNVPFRVLP